MCREHFIHIAGCLSLRRSLGLGTIFLCLDSDMWWYSQEVHLHIFYFSQGWIQACSTHHALQCFLPFHIFFAISTTKIRSHTHGEDEHIWHFYANFPQTSHRAVWQDMYVVLGQWPVKPLWYITSHVRLPYATSSQGDACIFHGFIVVGMVGEIVIFIGCSKRYRILCVFFFSLERVGEDACPNFFVFWMMSTHLVFCTLCIGGNMTLKNH